MTFAQGGFTLHKWDSNTRELDTVNTHTSNETSDTQETYAKQQLGVVQRGQGALLGISWDMVADTIQVKFPPEHAQPTKRSLLAKVVKIYDPLGLVSPITLCGKLLYCETCDLKIAWHKEIPEQLSRKLTRWEELS